MADKEVVKMTVKMAQKVSRGEEAGKYVELKLREST